jgi:hypothetical protein
MQAGISTWGRAPIHRRYRFILRGSAKPVLDYLINIAELAEFDRICIFLSVVSWSGIMNDKGRYRQHPRRQRLRPFQAVSLATEIPSRSFTAS